jgi:predicted permease
MERIPGIRRFFRLPADASTVTREIEEEIAFHLEERVQALVGRGMALAEARREAEREFGDVGAARAELAEIDRLTVRRERRSRWWDAFRYDARLAVRGLRREPAFGAAVVVMLALGIGVNAAMFGIADRLLLSAPSQVVEPDDVVRVLYRHTPSRSGELTTTSIVPYADYAALRDGVPGFGEVAAYSVSFYSVLGRGAEATELEIVGVTGEYFRTLGVEPEMGRFIREAEDTPPVGGRVLVLSHAFWRSRFGGDPGVIGRTVEVDHASYEVIGVAPRGFNGIDLEPVHAWVPVSALGADRGGDDWHITRNMHWLHIVARLAPGATPQVVGEQASATFVAAYGDRFKDDGTAGVVLGSLIAARAPDVGVATAQRSGRIALWLLGVSLLVLVIACANVANLMLARGMRRQREVGVRLAVGVGRLRLAGQVLTETLVLTLAGAVLGLVLAHWSGQLARSLLLPDMEWTGSPIDRRVLLFAVAIAGATALLAALAPALHAARADVVVLLGLGGRATHRRSRLRSGLVALQAMLSVLLLVGAGLFVRSLNRAASVPLGFDPDRVATFGWHATALGWDAARTRALYDAGVERVRGLPEVEAAALGMTSPMNSALYGSIRVPGLDSVPNPPGGGPYFSAVTPDYFRTLGARIVRGRPFTSRDVSGSTAVVIVTELLARMLWPGQDALGRCLVHLNEDEQTCREVVGVVEDSRYSTVEGEPTAMFFSPLAQASGRGWRTLFVRLNDDPAAGIAAVRRALVALEPGLPHVRATLLRTRVDPQLQPWRLGATMFTVFGALALVLAAVGVYGVIAYDVARRRRELGVRVAFGARAPGLVAMVLGDAVKLTAVGALAGVALAGWAAPLIEPLLFRVSPRDPVVLAAVAALILTIGLLAAAMPAVRAARVQPTEALREE